MNIYKGKIGNILRRMKGNKRILYLTFCSVLVLFCLVLNMTFSLITQEKNVVGSNITIKDLKYNMIINEVVKDESVGTKEATNTVIGDRIILLKSGKTEQFNIVLTSLNSIDSKYEITYKVCTNVNCTNFIDTPSSISIAYHIDTPTINGTILSNEKKSVILVTDNQDNKDYYVQINLNVGYIHNDLVLTNQITNKFKPGSLEGNLSIIAYVDGVEVETFPTEPNYETGVTCLYKDGSTSPARGIFKFISGKGWVVDVFDLDKSLTTCRVDFTEVLKVTYEVLINRYDCANLTTTKPTDPIIKYTGNCSLISDTEDANGKHTWRLKFLSSGTLSVNGLMYIDAFLVGGGAGGGNGYKSSNGSEFGGPGGGGGYTTTKKSLRLDNTTSYAITVGAGGGRASNGGASSAFGYSASGGYANGNGGSGGGGGALEQSSGSAGGRYGNSAPKNWNGECNGQGTTTCEFGEGTLSGCTRGDAYEYSRGGNGGGGGAYGSGIVGTSYGYANTGGGGGGAGRNSSNGTAGGSGVVVIRDVRA